MKRMVCVVLLSFCLVNLVKAQEAPLEKYSAFRYYQSDKNGKGYKLRHYEVLLRRCLFYVYKNRIVYTTKGSTVYKIYKIKRYSDDTHYFANDSSGAYYDIVIYHSEFDNQTYYAVNVFKTDKNGNWLALTRFDLKKLP